MHSTINPDSQESFDLSKRRVKLLVSEANHEKYQLKHLCKTAYFSLSVSPLLALFLVSKINRILINYCLTNDESKTEFSCISVGEF